MKKLTLLTIFLSFHVFGQIDANSLMGIPHTTDTAEMNAIENVSEGSMIYNKATKSMYLYDGEKWVRGNKNTIGDIKYSAQTQDHNGWYLLDGRATTSLSNEAKLNAENIGFLSNLPNAEDRVLKHPASGESIGDTGGQASTVISQDNLPNVTFSGITATAGAHSHTINKSLDDQRIFNNVDASRNFFGGNGTSNTSEDGEHTHTVTVQSGGNDEPIENYQPYLVFNVFIYLGL
ncbi:hypothetical protein [Tenacibaculum sp. SG-28]|uniref:hypothetical protein n=1 Tax=Tenacibaculum sp. SG-28 TaxID=754426 RepID=UPI000CF3B3D6|nr:hypothetical protein [Tenacibaculum sp. SG-28]PQJ19715.1 hypothetical protein BSU00_12185 [Tenacibaculum sp. SG-28]